MKRRIMTEDERPFFITGMPVELRHRLKVQAAIEGRPMRELLIQAVEDYMARINGTEREA